VIQLTLGSSSASTYTCQAADVMTDALRSFVRLQLIPAALDQ
jgi:hypothetical protein